MTHQNIPKQTAKTTRQLTEELNDVVDRNRVLEDKMKKMEELLKIVMERCDSDEISERNITRGENKCAECDESFASKFLLRNHIAKHHKRTKSVKSIPCKLCSETFEENWLLEVHLKSHDDAETFECEVCSNAMIRKIQL